MKEKISINMFPANDGDSILITCYGKKSTRILVDTGVSHTYNNHIKDYLLKLPEEQQILDLLIFTHLHQDHIEGGISLFKDIEIIDKIKINEVWLNGFKHIPFLDDLESIILNEKDKEKLQDMLFEYKNNPIKGTSNTISASQNLDLEDLISEDIWNKSFDDLTSSAVCSEKKDPIELTGEIKIRILSPSKNDLKNLGRIFIKELKKQYKGPINRDKIILKLFERIISQQHFDNDNELYKKINFTTFNLENLLLDDSKMLESDYVNKSSISFVLEYYEKKYLFMGDCYSDQIMDQIKELYKTNENKVYFDAIKVAHHGSKFNMQKKFLDLVDSEHFFISTDGLQHGHPNIETLARIVCRPTEVKRNLYFNYETEVSNKMSDTIFMDRYKYSVEIVKGDKYIPERKDKYDCR